MLRLPGIWPHLAVWTSSRAAICAAQLLGLRGRKILVGPTILSYQLLNHAQVGVANFSQNVRQNGPRVTGAVLKRAREWARTGDGVS